LLNTVEVNSQIKRNAEKVLLFGRLHADRRHYAERHYAVAHKEVLQRYPLRDDGTSGRHLKESQAPGRMG
jgi:hypothetical protein